MNFNTKEEKLNYFKDYLEAQDMLVERINEVEQTPGFDPIDCLITASRIETFESEDAEAQDRAGEILENQGTVALIDEMRNNDLKIKPLFVSEIMVYSMKDDDGEYFVLKTIAQLSSTPEYQQIIHKGEMDMNSPQEEFVAFIADSIEGISELKTNMDNYNKENK